MAPGRSLSPGGSYGRAQAIIYWALSNWQQFDGWCCSRNIDPSELPAYRFYNLALFVLKDGMLDEQVAELENILSLCDDLRHPCHDLKFVVPGIRLASPKVTAPQKPETRHKYIPPWWRGEAAAYNSAKAAMAGVNSLPTMSR